MLRHHTSSWEGSRFQRSRLPGLQSDEAQAKEYPGHANTQRQKQQFSFIRRSSAISAAGHSALGS